MKQANEIRDQYWERVYCNFSTADCVNHEIYYGALAEETGDKVFSKFLKIQVARRKILAHGGDPADTQERLALFAKGLLDSEVGSSDAYMGAVAIGNCACAGFRPGIESAKLLGISLEKGKLGFFQKAAQLIGESRRGLEGMAKEAHARTRTALANEYFAENRDLKTLDKEFGAVVEIVPDYSPAYFFHANHSRQLWRDSGQVDANTVVQRFEDTAQVTLKSLDLGISLAELRGEKRHLLLEKVPLTSGLPLALLQLELVETLVAIEGKKHLVGASADIHHRLDQLEARRFDFVN